MSFLRSCWFIAWVCFCANWIGVQAQTSAVVRLDTDTKTASTMPAPLSVAVGLDATLTIQDVAALPLDRFVPYVPRTTHPISIDHPLWLHMQVDAGEAKASPNTSGWLLEIPTVIVDRYEVYQKDASGAWQMAIAGDRVAHTEWPLSSLRPRFPLRAASGGVQDVYIRVIHQLPATIQPIIVESSFAAERDSVHTLWMGIVAGVIAAVCMACLQMAFVFRDKTYVWYAAYLLASMFAALAYAGIGHRFLWPEASSFSSDAVVCFIMAAYAFNLLFVNAMFGKWLSRFFGQATWVLVAACAAWIIHSLLTENYAISAIVFVVIVVLASALILTTAVRAWLKAVPYSGYWLLVYLPFLLNICLAVAHNSGQLSLPELPDYIPMLTYIAEASAMLFCLNAYNRERHAQATREQVAAQRDPLTGFLTEVDFLVIASKAWLNASERRNDMTLAYVLVESKDKEVGAIQFEALMLRSVRLVRIAMRETDSMGRIGRNMLGIAMPGMKPGEDLNARLSRLIALGLMLDPSDSRAHALNFTLAVGSRRVHPMIFNEMDQRLRALLVKDSEERPRTIRFLKGEISLTRPAQ
jgi:two-component system, sensor histidine kinase LadS